MTKFERIKPHINVGTIGHIGQGNATLSAAIVTALLTKSTGVKPEFMPILRHSDFRLPWSLIAPHARQAMKNHSQTLERLAERGGLSFCEAAAILENRKWSRIVWPAGQQRDVDPAQAYLEKLMAARAAQEARDPV